MTRARSSSRIGPRRIHVNVSARQLDSGNFAQMVEQGLHDARLQPDLLAIEFTETHLARIRPELLDDLRALNATGVGLAADDFGTGYSPLTKHHAEGVESLEAAAALQRLGCLFGQGYLWSSAVPGERFLQQLVASDATASSSLLISGG